MDCDVTDVNSAPDESAKESSYFHVHGSHFVSGACLVFPFSLVWPTLLTCSGRASVTATGHISSFCLKLESVASGTLYICLWNPRVLRNPLWESLC